MCIAPALAAVFVQWHTTNLRPSWNIDEVPTLWASTPWLGAMPGLERVGEALPTATQLVALPALLPRAVLFSIVWSLGATCGLAGRAAFDAHLRAAFAEAVAAGVLAPEAGDAASIMFPDSAQVSTREAWEEGGWGRHVRPRYAGSGQHKRCWGDASSCRCAQGPGEGAHWLPLLVWPLQAPAGRGSLGMPTGAPTCVFLCACGLVGSRVRLSQ